MDLDVRVLLFSGIGAHQRAPLRSLLAVRRRQLFAPGSCCMALRAVEVLVVSQCHYRRDACCPNRGNKGCYKDHEHDS
jgi:hypothetical protein